MLKYKWQAIAALAIATAVSLFLNPVEKEIIRVVEVEKKVIVHQNREKVREEKKPDGTTIRTVTKTITEKSKNEKSTSEETVRETLKISRYAFSYRASLYSLGHVPFSNITSPKEAILGAGVRLGNLPLWLEFDTNVFKSEYYLGLRLEL